MMPRRPPSASASRRSIILIALSLLRPFVRVQASGAAARQRCVSGLQGPGAAGPEGKAAKRSARIRSSEVPQPPTTPCSPLRPCLTPSRQERWSVSIQTPLKP